MFRRLKCWFGYHDTYRWHEVSGMFLTTKFYEGYRRCPYKKHLSTLH